MFKPNRIMSIWKENMIYTPNTLNIDFKTYIINSKAQKNAGRYVDLLVTKI